MAKRVVDFLETVEIDVEQHKSLASLHSARQLRVKQLREQPAVWQAGQVIMPGNILGLRRSLAELLHDTLRPQRQKRGQQRRHGQQP
jgi:hypothetical protein